MKGVMEMLLRIAAGVIIGGALGFLYYKLVGCPTGSCPITRNPIHSTLYGAVMGMLLSTAFYN